jgi:hypothetical protein
MADLDSIVSVSITADSATPTRAGFGIPLLMSYHTRWTDSYRSYTALSEMTADGFVTYDHAYLMAAAVFRANPTVEYVIVGRMTSAPAYTSVLTITDATEGNHIKVSVIDPTSGTVTAIDYTILAAATTTTVATAVEALIEAVTGVTSSASVADITVTPAAAGKKVFMYGLTGCKLVETTADAGYDTALTALQLENDDWYFILIDSNSQANVNDVAAFALASTKMFFITTESSYELDGTGTLGSTIKALSNTHAVLLYTPNAHEFGAATWVGVGAPQTPGSITWAFQTLPGVTARTLTNTQKLALEADNTNHYQTIAGISITRPGVTLEGEWIDVIHGIDALTMRIKEDVFGLLASGRVPFTQKGMDLVHSTILAALRAFEGTTEEPGLIAVGTSQVIMPVFSSISASDKANRRLVGIRFSGTLAGAIHFVSVVGTLSNV